MLDYSEIHPTTWERIRFAILRFDLTVRGGRFSADPFERWSSKCPACGRSYDFHEQAVLGGAPPGTEFETAVANHDWEQARRLGTSGEPMGRNDIVVAWVLRCPIENRLVLFTAYDPYGFSPPQLISYQILTAPIADRLLPRLGEFQRVVHDVYLEAIAAERRAGALRRRLPLRTRIFRFFTGSALGPLTLIFAAMFVTLLLRCNDGGS